MEINYRTYKEKNWIDGLIEGCHFSAEVFDEGSKYGIDNGRISRLNMVDKSGTLQIYYDRDWNIKPTGKIKAIYKQLVSFFETFPKGKRLDQHYKAQVIKS